MTLREKTTLCANCGEEPRLKWRSVGKRCLALIMAKRDKERTVERQQQTRKHPEHNDVMARMASQKLR